MCWPKFSNVVARNRRPSFGRHPLRPSFVPFSGPAQRLGEAVRNVEEVDAVAAEEVDAPEELQAGNVEEVDAVAAEVLWSDVNEEGLIDVDDNEPFSSQSTHAPAADEALQANLLESLINAAEVLAEVNLCVGAAITKLTHKFHEDLKRDLLDLGGAAAVTLSSIEDALASNIGNITVPMTNSLTNASNGHVMSWHTLHEAVKQALGDIFAPVDEGSPSKRSRQE